MWYYHQYNFIFFIVVILNDIILRELLRILALYFSSGRCG